MTRTARAAPDNLRQIALRLSTTTTYLILAPLHEIDSYSLPGHALVGGLHDGERNVPTLQLSGLQQPPPSNLQWRNVSDHCAPWGFLRE